MSPWGGAPGMVKFYQDHTQVWWCPHREAHTIVHDNEDDGSCPLCGYSRRDRHIFICSLSRPKE